LRPEENPSLLENFSKTILSFVEEPAVETNVPQLYRAAGQKIPCIAPVRYVYGVDGSYAETACSEDRRRSTAAQLPLMPIRNGYTASHRAYLEKARTIASYATKSTQLPYDLYLPLHSVRCRPRLGCRKEKRLYDLASGTIQRHDTYRPFIILPTILHYRILRPVKELRIAVPWIVVKEPVTCSIYLCPYRSCHVTVEGSTLEFSDVPLYRKGRRCSKGRTAQDAIAALIEEVHGYKPPKPAEEPTFLVLGSVVVLDVKERQGEYVILIWNPTTLPTRATFIFTRERVIAASVYSPVVGREALVPEYDRVAVPLRRHGVAEVYVRTRRIPRFLLAPRHDTGLSGG